LIRNCSINTEAGIKLNKKNIHEMIALIKKEKNLNIESLEINFVNEKTILEINTEYLGHKYPTDVISFNYSDESNNLDGEIFICYDTAEENAKRFSAKFDDEIKRLVIHGILHLIGYDDVVKSKREKMRSEEDRLLAKTKRFGKVVKNK